MLEYTPGPWAVDKVQKRMNGSWKIVSQSQGTAIAILFEWQFYDDQAFAERAANASLVCSAPAMYQALVLLDECHSGKRPLSTLDLDWEDAWKDVKKALALARGAEANEVSQEKQR